MKISEDNTSAYNSLPGELVLRQLHQYVSYKQRLDLKQQELKNIYNNRPCLDSLPDDIHHGTYLLALDYYRTKLFRCLQEINDLEQALEDTKNIIGEFVPDNGKLRNIKLDGEKYIKGFLKMSELTNRFVLVKKAPAKKASNRNYLPAK